jgi:hypothetical protein
MDRIHEEISNPKLRDELVDKVEDGTDLANSDAAKIYSLEVDRGPANTKFKRLEITRHAQYRMDLRGVTVPEVRLALMQFYNAWNKERSTKSPKAQRWESDMIRDGVKWTSPSLGLTVVFTLAGDTVRLLTAYWEGAPNPKPVSEAVCRVR